MRQMLRAGFALVLFAEILGSRTLRAADATPPATQPAAADAGQAALEAQFVKTMTKAHLVGRFILEGVDKAPGEEHYTINSVKKLHGDLWLLVARIQFGSKDVNVPLILPVKWAGDTPVIEVTGMGIPGIGTYTARVVIYDDHYSGIWSGSPTHRGALFGKIEHPPTTQPTKQ